MMELNKTIAWIIALCGLLFLHIEVKAQTVSPGFQSDGKSVNNIYTSLPFLLITPDARSGGMGEVGVAISPDVNSIYWNPAKLTFSPDSTGISVSYTPWLRNLVSDVNLSYLSFYHRLNDRDALGFSLKHFSLGQIQIMDGNENSYGSYKPSEMALDAVFSRKLSENFSLGIAFRYINSNLNNGISGDAGYQSKPISTFSGDISAYYKKGTRILGSDGELALGLNVSNLGNKVTYQKGSIKYYLPANMKLGVATTLFNNLDKFTLSLDFNKLLVPTNPERDINENVIRGKETDRSLVGGIFGSFNDAPGGFAEELREINYSFGAEYWIRNQFALRAGYFFEDPSKGNRKYMTTGIGVNYKKRIKMDLAYVMADRQKTPLAQTLRITLALNINRNNIADTQEQREAKRLLDAEIKQAQAPEKALLEQGLSKKEIRAKRKADKKAAEEKNKAALPKLKPYQPKKKEVRNEEI